MIIYSFKLVFSKSHNFRALNVSAKLRNQTCPTILVIIINNCISDYMFLLTVALLSNTVYN